MRSRIDCNQPTMYTRTFVVCDWWLAMISFLLRSFYQPNNKCNKGRKKKPKKNKKEIKTLFFMQFVLNLKFVRNNERKYKRTKRCRK